MMAEKKVLETLRAMQFFHGVGDEDLNKLAGCAKLEDYPAATAIYREGETANNFFLVVNGSVGLEIVAGKGGVRRIFTVDSGELVGLSPVLKAGAMRATARTLDKTTLVSFDGARTLALLEQEPKLEALL